MNIYLAAPLFSQAERQWNQGFVRTLSGLLPQARFILPQTFAVDRQDAHGSLHAQCVDAVEKADVILAVLDGPDVDCGVAWEMGYASGLNKPVIGVRTDLRQSQEQGVNLMVSRSCAHLIRARALDDDLPALARDVARRLEKFSVQSAESRARPGKTLHAES